MIKEAYAAGAAAAEKELEKLAVAGALKGAWKGMKGLSSQAGAAATTQAKRVGGHIAQRHPQAAATAAQYGARAAGYIKQNPIRSAAGAGGAGFLAGR